MGGGALAAGMAYVGHGLPFNRFRGLRAKRMVRPGEDSSDVTTRAQVLVEQPVVAINIGLVFRGELLASARSLNLGLGALAIEGVELGPDRAARLPRC